MGSHVWLPPRLCQHGGARGLTCRILPVQKPAIFSGLNNKKMFIFFGKCTGFSRRPAPLKHGKKERSASLNTQQKAKKRLLFGSQKKYSGLGHCISLVKDNLIIVRIAAGISPGTTIFFVPACKVYLP